MCCAMPMLRVTLLAVLSAATSAARAAPPRDPGEADEAWLGAVALDELRRCEGGEAWARLRDELEAAALARLACGRLDRLAALTDLVYATRACAYLPVLERLPDGRKLARWLLDHRDVARRLFRALDDAREPAEALRRFSRLHAAGAQSVCDYPGLAVAFATAGPLRHVRRQPDPAGLVESFRYYTAAGATFRCDLKTMPYEVARYLADTRTNLEERRWAARTYRFRRPASAYFQVRYDVAHFETGRAKRIDSLPYSLPNLARHGGVCLDRAYYAAEVCKAMGIPATIVHGRGGEGVEHAWIAHWRETGSASRGRWVSRTGRFEEQSYFVGEVRDPVDGRMIYDSELMLLGSAAALPLRRREEADAATTLADLVDRRRGAEVNLAPLRRLARSYGVRLERAPRAVPRKVGWIAARRKIDLSLLEDLLAAAIARNVAHGPAWRLLVRLRKADRIPVADVNGFFATLIHKTADRYPDYSCLLVMQIAATIPDPAQRRKAYSRAMTVYGRRPDLRGRLRIALGDDFQTEGRTDEALAAYRGAAGQNVHLAEVVVQAAGRAERLLVQAGRRDEAIGMYRELFAKTRREKLAPIFRAQTSHYQLGNRLAALLKASGEAAAARRVLAQIAG